VQVVDNETITVTDTASFPDVFDPESVHVNDAVFVTPLINVGAPVADYSAGSLGFGNVAAGQTGTQTLTVSDIGKSPLTLSSASLSAGSAFSVTQISCSNSTTALPTTLQSGGACTFLISYLAPAGAPATDHLTFTDNAALSNVTSTPAGSNYTQSIPLNGSGSSTAPPPPPPAVVPVMVSETVHVTDTASFPDVFDAETVRVADSVFVTPIINVGAPVAEYSAGSLGFGGQSGSQTITVSNIGQASLTLASATISGGSQFVITQISCTNSATSLSTVLSSGAVCTVTIGYTVSATPPNDIATLTFTDNAALSNVTSTPAGSSFTQSISLNGSGTSTPPPPPPPAVIPIAVNETVHVTDTASFPDVFDAETVRVADSVFVTPIINVGAPVAEYSAGSLGFGSVAPGQTGIQTLAVSDIGKSALTLSSASLSAGSAFTITQIACSNSATALPTTLQSGGACTFLISYLAPAGAAASDSLTFTDNAALSNVTSTPAGSSFTQSIALFGSGTTTPPPPPPPAVVPVVDNETIQVTDTPSFPDVSDAEQISVTDQVSIQVLNATATSISVNGSAVYGTPVTATVSVSSSTSAVTGNVTLSVDGGTPATMLLSSGSAAFNLGVLKAGSHTLMANFAAQGNFTASSGQATLVVTQATPTITWANPAPITLGTALSAVQLDATANVAGTFAYTPASGTVLGAGDHALSVTFSPTDSTDYTSATASVTVLVLNTIVGTNVGVTPVDTTTGSTPVTLTYSNVTKAGTTGLTTSSTGASAPPSFQLGVPPVYYDISTTATFTGLATVCIHYSGITFIQPPHLFHLENGVLVDRTISIDPVNMIVCGTVTSFSPFALFAPLPVLTITANSVPRLYGQANPAFAVSYSGFVNGDTPSVLSGTLSCVSPATPASPVGTYAITCSGLSSPNYVVQYAGGLLTVTPASTTTSVSVSPSSVQYSDYTALTATISPTSAAGQALTGNVQFSLNGGTVGSAVPINSSGVATLSQVQVNLSAGSYPVKAVFSSTNANFAGSSSSATQIVSQENAFILYSGDTIAQVGSSLTLRATVWDSAAVGYPGTNPETGLTATIGDITKMWIAFDIYPAGSCGSGTPTTLYAQVGLTSTAGVGTATATLSSSSEVSDCVISRLVAGGSGGTNQYYTAPIAQGVGLDFYVNSGQFATGGGWVNDATGSHGNLGFNARYNSTGTPKGQMVYIYRALYNGVVADFIIKSNALSALQFSGTTYPISSTLQGKVNVQINRASDGYSLFSAGNYTFSATVTDSGQNGTTGKQFSLIVYDTSGVPYHSVPAGTPLQGGNVVVHSQ
jgi:hypothetical protein